MEFENNDLNTDINIKLREVTDPIESEEVIPEPSLLPFALVQTTRLKRELWLRVSNLPIPLKQNDTVIFDFERDGILGQHFGTVLRVANQPTYDPTGRVRRVASIEDLTRMKDCLFGNEALERIFRTNVREEKLPMTLQAIEQGFDGKKITFYYKAEDKVDFRKLVKLLAASCKCRIELYQLSIKEQFIFHSCLGICGLTTCCTRQQNLFERKISPALAKKQKLMFNAAKMSGCCGKPRCCLMYEADQYSEYTAELPRMNSLVEFNGEEYKVIDWDYCHETITLENTDPDKENAQEVVAAVEIPKMKAVTTPRNFDTFQQTVIIEEDIKVFEPKEKSIHDIYFADDKSSKHNGRNRPDHS